MSVDLGGLINRIPQEKLNELVNRFTDDTTAQEVLDFLSSAGIDASDEEVHALKESLLLKDSELLAVSDESMEEVVGGKEDQSISWREIDQPQCLECKFLPCCLGGCPMHRIEEGVPECPSALFDPDSFAIERLMETGRYAPSPAS